MARTVIRLAVIVVTVAAAVASAQAAEGPEWGATWQNGPSTTFPQAFSRFDGAYDPGSGLVYFLGGRLADNGTDGSIWTFNPTTGVYADTGLDMPTPISNYTINVLTDSTGVGFYVFCGRPAAGGVVSSVQVFYPASSTVAQLPAADDFPGDATHSCSSAMNAVVGNKVYVAGGFDATNNSEQTWIFDPMAPSGSRWTRIASADLAQARAYMMGAVVDGKIYAIGGAWFDGSVLVNVTTVEVLDPASPSPTWSALAPLPEACSSSRAWGFDTGSLYIDPSDMTPLAGKIISGCGFWSTAIQAVYAYTVATNTWEAFPPFNTARRDQAGEFLPISGAAAIWVWGGYDQASANTTSSEFYSFELVPVELQSFTIE